MAAAAKMPCYCCGEPVAVRLNRANRAYYHCGHCGLSVVSKDSDSTERMLNKNVIPPTSKPKESTHTEPNTPKKPALAGNIQTEIPQPAPAKKSAFKTLMDT